MEAEEIIELAEARITELEAEVVRLREAADGLATTWEQGAEEGRERVRFWRGSPEEREVLANATGLEVCAADLRRVFDSMKKEVSSDGIAELEAEVERLEALLGLRDPWSLPDAARVLAAAGRHMLTDHDCDHLGWERVQHACDAVDRLVPSTPGEVFPLAHATADDLPST